MRSFHLSALILLVLVVGCTEPTAVEEVRYAVEPPELYQTFYSDAESCSGVQGDFERVTWYWTQSFPGSYDTVGQWNARREITLLWRFRLDRRVVVHEVIHDLLGGDKDHVHPAWSACDVPI